MLRFRLSLWIVVFSLLYSSFISAQEESDDSAKPIKATPEILALMKESHQAMESLPNQEKTLALFQLLAVELRFTDKQAARNTIQQISLLIPAIEKESVQTQILEAVAIAQTDIGDYAESVKTLDKIAKASARAEKQLNIAEKILDETEKNKPEKPFDITELLRKSLAGAVEAKDAGLEALVSVVLGRELLKQEKIDEAKTIFAGARKKAKEIEEIEERNLVALIVRSLASGGQIDEAQAVIETVSDDETKQMFRSLAAVSLAQNGKMDDAEKLVKTFKPGDAADNAVIGIAKEEVKTLTVEKFQELAKLMSSPERREMLLQSVIQTLLENNRNDAAAELAKLSEKATELQMRLNIRQLESLIDAKKFDDAAKLIETLDDDLKPIATRHLLMLKFREKDGDNEELLNQISATFSVEEKKQIEMLRAEAEKASKVENIDNRLNVLLQVIQAQFQGVDLQGAKQTLGFMLEAAHQSSEPAQVVRNLLTLSQIQMELNDKAGVKENLGRLLQFLDGIKDVMTLKNLVPDEESQNPQSQPKQQAEMTQPVLALKPPVDESAIKDSLFQVYVSTTDILNQAGADAEGKKSFEKAKNIAESETDALRKAEKLLILSRLLSSFPSEPQR